MNILMICTEKLPVPAVKGGAIQTYIDGVSTSLSDKHQLTILGTTDPSLPDDETKNNIRYVRTQGGLIEVYREGVKRFLKENPSFDVIHIFNRPRLVLPVRECAPNARLILSMHNDMFKPEKIDQEEASKVVDELDHIITVSDYIGKTIYEPFPKAKNKIQTIYSGVDISRFVPPSSTKAKEMREQIRKENNLEGKKVILFAGRLSPNKGVDVLIRAVPEITKKHPDIALVIVGSKWFSVDEVTDYIGYVRALAARLPVPVINTGFVHPSEIQKWFAASDVFVCTSQWQEPLARVHYEAMASGLPIVTTNRGGNAEVIIPNGNGFVIDNPEDPQAFADQISHLLSNPSLSKELGKKGRELAESQYTWSRVISEIDSIWSEMKKRIEKGISVQMIDQTNDETPVKTVDEHRDQLADEPTQFDQLSPVLDEVEQTKDRLIDDRTDSNDQMSSIDEDHTSLEQEPEPTEDVIPLNEIIEDLNDQVNSEEDSSETLVPSLDDKVSLDEVIDDLNDQISSNDEDDTLAPSEDNKPLNEIIEDLNDQVNSEEDSPETLVPTFNDKVPLDEVIDDLNNQISSNDEDDTLAPSEDNMLLEDVIKDLNDAASFDENDMQEEYKDIDDITHDLTEQVSFFEEDDKHEIKEFLQESMNKPTMKKKNRKQLIIQEISGQDELLKVLIYRIQEKRKTNKPHSMRSKQWSQKDVLSDIQNLIQSQSVSNEQQNTLSQEDRKKVFFEAVNDITTAKLFEKLAEKRKRKTRTKKRQ
ncbi:lipopolysaccharide 1,2-N-acetylglucosaminetransferase [Halalkalibacter wakoensis JCM 9140]|uniref:Lipopolysaccharide 1,2-N-acetylglucosaminetransferase n=1 Tax=Halalkalibacter wakoensis JCM 9140 TaxID=1236970 RepID=W4PXS4_9BACI|nr:glycosyltransferase family 4 protein [Halalkalibacter wakoensis]GAE24465.1 lipopolysaccharide 1,2-N-acetylglucosaminetransferase [Halalkalibacter wakoensis JCM 9140]